MLKLAKQASGRLVGRRFEQPPPPELMRGVGVPEGAEGVVAKSERVRQIAGDTLKSRFSSDPGIRFGDSCYYLPTLNEVQFILSASQLDRRTWTAERFDCDDFAYVLKGEMSVHSYDAGEIRYGLCVGMVWGNFDWVQGYHAVNWFVGNDMLLRFIEPQTDIVYDAEHCEGDIGLLLV